MNIGSVLYRLSPVQGTYRSINHEYKWVLRGCNAVVTLQKAVIPLDEDRSIVHI
jgi:hypothetical protein